MKRRIKIILAILAGSFATLLVGGVLILRTPAAGTKICAMAKGAIADAASADVEIGRCVVDPIFLEVTIEDLRIVPKGGQKPLVAVKKVFAKLAYASLFSGRLRVVRAEIQSPEVNLVVPESTDESPGGAEAKEEPSKRCLPAFLEDLDVDHVHIRDGIVGVKFPGGSVKVKKVRLKIEGDGKVFHVELKTGSATYKGPVKVRAKKLRLDATLDVERQSVDVEKLDIVTKQASIFAKGGLTELCQGAGHVAAVINADLAESAAAYAPTLTGAGGRVAITAEARFGPEVIFESSGDLTVVGGSLLNLALGDLRADFKLDTAGLKVDRLELPVGRGKVIANADLGFSTSLPLRAALDLTDVEFSKLMEKLGVKDLPMRALFTGKAHVSGSLARLRLGGDLAVSATDFAILGGKPAAPTRVIGFKSGLLDAEWRLSPEKFTLSAARITTGRTALAMSGDIALKPAIVLDLNVVGDPVDLSELSPVANQAMEGQGTLKVSIRGPPKSLEILSSTDLRAFRFAGVSFGVVYAATRLTLRDRRLQILGLNGQKGRSQYALEGVLDLEDLSAHAKLELTENRIADLVDLASGVSPAVGNLRGKMAGLISGVIEVDGPLLAPQATAKLDLTELDLFGQKFDVGRIEARIDGRAVHVDQVSLGRGKASVRLSGDMSTDQQLDFQLEVKALALDQVDPAASAGVALGGVASLTAQVTGSAIKPVVAAEFEIDDLVAADAPVGPVKLKLGLEGRTLRVRGTIDKTRVEARADLDGAMPFFLNANLKFEDLIAKIPPAKRPKDLAVALGGNLEVAGSLVAPLGSRGKLSLDKLEIFVVQRRFRNRGPVLVDFRGRSVSVKALTLVGGGGELAVQGVYTASGLLDLQANASANLSAFEGLVPLVEGLDGQVEVSTGLTGTLADPQLIGSALLRGVAFRLKDGVPMVFKNMSGRIAFSQSSVVLEGLSSDLNSGQISARGEVGLENYKPGKLHLTVDLSNVDLKPQEDLPIVLGGRLELYGRPDQLVLGGDVEILRLRFARAIAINLRDFANRPPAPKVFEKSGEFLRFDLGVHASRNIKVETQVQVSAVAVNIDALARLELRCDLKVTGTNRRLGLLGSASSLAGTALFKGNEFNIDSTVVSFGDAYRIAPSFDINATGTVRDYRVTMHAYGTPGDPRVDLSSDPELPEADIITLLTLGLTSQDVARVVSQGAGAGLGLLAESAFSGLGLDQKAKNLSIDELGLKDVNVRVSSMYSESSGRVEPTIEVESKFVWDELKLRGSTPFSGGKGKRAKAEYRLSDRLSLQAQLDDENAGADQAPVNLGFGFKLHWVQQ